MTRFLTERLLFFAQTMVYTIHEIPIFIAMGVVGKGLPSGTPTRLAPCVPIAQGGGQHLPAGAQQAVWSGPAGLQAWPRFEVSGEACSPHTLLAAPQPPGEEVHTLGTPALCSIGRAM